MLSNGTFLKAARYRVVTPWRFQPAGRARQVLLEMADQTTKYGVEAYVALENPIEMRAV